MRKVLNNIEVVGATMVYQERETCRWSIDWLIDFCDRVIILLDNYDKETEAIVLDYKKKYPKKIYIRYSTHPIENWRNVGSGIKQRLKKYQQYIREQVVKELKKMHDEKPIDLLIWPDSDETFLDCFTEYLERFWHEQTAHSYMMLGFVEVYDDFKKIISQRMGPHGRVFRYVPEFSCIPRRSRTVQNPYYGTKPWKIRPMVLHMCNFSKVSRDSRERVTGRNMMNEMLQPREIWLLDKDVRTMFPEELGKYMYSPKGAKPEIKGILLEDYLKKPKDEIK